VASSTHCPNKKKAMVAMTTVSILNSNRSDCKYLWRPMCIILTCEGWYYYLHVENIYMTTSFHQEGRFGPGKHLHDNIISSRGEVWTNKTSLTRPLFIYWIACTKSGKWAVVYDFGTVPTVWYLNFFLSKIKYHKFPPS